MLHKASSSASIMHPKLIKMLISQLIKEEKDNYNIIAYIMRKIHIVLNRSCTLFCIEILQFNKYNKTIILLLQYNTLNYKYSIIY
jgi:hypothetical protein